MAECGSNFFRATLLQGAYCVRCSGLALRDGARARQFGTALADFYDPRHADRGHGPDLVEDFGRDGGIYVDQTQGNARLLITAEVVRSLARPRTTTSPLPAGQPCGSPWPLIGVNLLVPCWAQCGAVAICQSQTPTITSSSTPDAALRT